ncbi:hypothetical protein [Natronomonas gomsonensis]|uniref:hypothetical protein n=1 Tax=Natronomonas gomsonensis TaxID=1046043 RepID=UPI0015B9C97F|nr:hypothetical protein [Natronomonas gomsonensis]
MRASATVTATAPSGGAGVASASVPESVVDSDPWFTDPNRLAGWADDVAGSVGAAELTGYPDANALGEAADVYLNRNRRKHRERLGGLVEDRPLGSDLWAAEADARLAAVAGPASTESESTTTVPTVTCVSDPFPWAGDPTADDKTRLVLTVAASGDSPTEPVPLGATLDAAFGQHTTTEYARASWVDEHHPELMEKCDTAEGLSLRVSEKALYLLRTGMGRSGTVPWATLPDAHDADGNPLPVRRFHEYLSGSRRGLTDGRRAIAFDLLADNRARFVDGPDETPRVLKGGTVPVVQRFTSSREAERLRSGLAEVFNAAEAAAQECTVWVLTLPRESADGPCHSYEVFQRAWERLYDRLRYARDVGDGRGSLPPYWYVQEAQPRSGWCHRHIGWCGPVGGSDPGLSTTRLRRWWADALRVPSGEWVVVDVEEPFALADGWHTADSDSHTHTDGEGKRVLADGGPGLRHYFGKGPRRLVEVASADVATLREWAARCRRGESTEALRERASLAFMWATERRFYGTGGGL